LSVGPRESNEERRTFLFIEDIDVQGAHLGREGGRERGRKGGREGR